MITAILTYLAIGATLWALLLSSGLPADVRMKRLLKGKRTRSSHQAIAVLVCVVVWPWAAVKYVVTRRVWG